MTCVKAKVPRIGSYGRVAKSSEAAVFMTLAMLALLIGLYVLCLALVRFVEGVIGPQRGA